MNEQTTDELACVLVLLTQGVPALFLLLMTVHVVRLSLAAAW